MKTNISRQRKKENKEHNTKILKGAGINFVSKNYGLHLIMQTRKDTYEFWPSKGKYLRRSDGEYFEDVYNLIKEIENEK